MRPSHFVIYILLLICTKLCTTTMLKPKTCHKKKHCTELPPTVCQDLIQNAKKAVKDTKIALLAAKKAFRLTVKKETEKLRKAKKRLLKAKRSCDPAAIKAAKIVYETVKKSAEIAIKAAKANVDLAKKAYLEAKNALKTAFKTAKQAELIIGELFYDPSTKGYYLTLINYNFSRDFIQDVKYAPEDSTVTTTWSKIRIDPCTLIVDTGDFTFSSSTGIDHHYPDHQTVVPYATGRCCESFNNACGDAKIDLTGTLFAVNDSFAVGGSQAAGGSTFSSANQVVDLRGGGFCGWIAPISVAHDENNMHMGGPYLHLKFIG